MEKKQIGYGTWKIPDNEKGIQIIQDALDVGYRYLDTAERYGNEQTVGKAIRLSNIPRQEVFVTSKVWKDKISYDAVLQAAENSLKRLDLDYIDVYLVHWPVPIGYDNSEKLNLEIWKAMEHLYEQKIVHNIGVANFMSRHLQSLLKYVNYLPSVNQIEMHPGCIQKEACEYCKKMGIQVEAWSPLGSGEVLQLPEIKGLANKYGVSEALVCLQWLKQKEIIPIVRSSNRSRMKENLNFGGFVLSSEEMLQLDQIPLMGDENGINPDTFMIDM